MLTCIELKTRIIKGKSPEVDELIGVTDTVWDRMVSSGEEISEKTVSCIVVERVEERVDWSVPGTRLSKVIRRLFDEKNAQHLLETTLTPN